MVWANSLRTTSVRLIITTLLVVLSGCSEPMQSGEGNVTVSIATPSSGVVTASSNTPLAGALLTTAYPYLSAVTMEIFAEGHNSASINRDYNNSRFTMVSGVDAFYIVDSTFSLNVPNDVDLFFTITAYNLSGYQVYTASAQLTAAQLAAGNAALPLAMVVDIDPSVPVHDIDAGCTGDADLDGLCDIYEDMFVRIDCNPAVANIADADCDGIPNRDDPDSDNDGVADGADGLAPSDNGYPSFIHANHAPTAVSLDLVATMGVAITGGALVDDVDVGDCHVISIASQPTNGVAAIVVAGPVDPANPYSCDSYEVNYTPNPGFVGTDSFDVRATDRNGLSTLGIVTVVVNSSNNTLPMIVDDAVTTAEEVAVNIDVLVNDSDADGDSLTVVTVTQPANGTVVIDPTLLSILYTPNANFFGTDSFDYSATDNISGTSSGTVTVTVTNVNDAPSITSTAPTTATEDTFYRYTAMVTDLDDANNGIDLSWSLLNAPTGMVVSSTGVVSWTPVEGDTTSGTVTLSVADGGEDGAVPASETFTLSVTAVNDAPSITSTAPTTATEDILYTYTPTVVDVDDANNGTDLSWSLLNAPTGMVVSSTGVVSWTPVNGDVDSGTVTLSVADGGEDGAAAASENLFIAVTAVNDPPVAANDTDTTSEDTPFTTINVLSNDTDIDGDPLSVSAADVSSANAALITNNGDGTFVYNPPLNFNGVDSFNYTISDGNGGSASAVVTITVNAVNDAPVALDDGDRTLLRSSLVSGFVEAQAKSAWPSVNGNGRFTAFWSEDATLVPGDTNGVYDLYLRDSQFASTIRVSVDSGGVEANAGETDPLQLHPAVISADSRYVIFESRANNLGSLGGLTKELYEHDRLAGVTYPLLDCEGGPTNGDSYEPAATPDFSAYAFTSDATDLWPGCFIPTSADDNNTSDIYYYSATLLEMRISEDASGVVGNGASFSPAISDDGLLVAFASSATNLIATDINGVDDIYLKNLTDASVTRISVDSAGNEVTGGHSNSPSMSSDGKRIAFASSATTLVAGDSNGVADIFVRDTGAGTTVRVSVDSSGTEANGASSAPRISKDGRFIVFESLASNLVADDTNGVSDIFVHDLVSGQTRRLSDDTLGTEGNGASVAASISNDGRYVVYSSAASNLVASDTNGVEDIFNTTLTDITSNEQIAVTTPNLLLNDSDVDSSPTISTFTQPTNGSVTDNGNDTYDYLPDPGAVGVDAFSYTISDGALSSTAWVWLATEAFNYVPQGVADVTTTIWPNAITISVLANDFDLDSDPLTVGSADTTSAWGGSVQLNPDNTITYTPPTSPSTGYIDSFYYTVTDGVASSANVQVQIDIP